jgi:hypothetical protein
MPDLFGEFKSDLFGEFKSDLREFMPALRRVYARPL